MSNVRQSPMICLSVHVKTCSFLRPLWQVMSRGSTGRTWRQKNNHHSGRVPRLCNQRSGARFKAKQRSCYWRFFILRVSYTMSTLLTGKQLTRNSTWRSCDVCVNHFAENNWKKWRDGNWILHHDNAPAHTSHLVQQFLAKHGTAQLH